MRNDNIGTLFLTVLRPRGTFFLTSGHPDAPPPRAWLEFVSHEEHVVPYHVAVKGRAAHSRFQAIAQLDLPGRWQDEYGLATLVDLFRRTDLGGPDRGGTVWEATGSWSVRDGRLVCEGDGLILTDAGTSDPQVEVLATAGPDTTSLSLVLRARDADNLLRFELGRDGSCLVRRVADRETVVEASRSDRVKLVDGRTHRLAARLEGHWIHLLIDDRPAWSGKIPPADRAEFPADGTKVGLWASGGERFAELVNWPISVEIPAALAELLPPVPLPADGLVVLRDDFDGADDSPLDGRRPTVGRGSWTVKAGRWRVEGGAAALADRSGMALIDTGLTDYDLSATIAMNGPPDFPA